MERLMFIAHQTDKYSYYDSVCLALEGGIRLIQLRMKDSAMQDIVAVAAKVKAECAKYNATLMIDDHVELVKPYSFDGVHLGKEDMPIDDARTALGKDVIIGATANTFEDVVRATEMGADYIGLGPFSYTKTKAKLAAILGIEGYANIISKLHKAKINIPIYAIGGIRLQDVRPLMATGLYGIAVSSSILLASNPIAMAKDFSTFATEI
jgi:thiamine-phosphate pyrophosphorylase